MNKEFVLYFGLLIPVIIVQLYIIPFFSIGNITPDLLAILTVYCVLKLGQINGTIFGAVAGFLYDLLSFQLLGGAMFSMTLAAFIMGYFYSEIRIESFIKTSRFVMLSIFFALCNNLVFSLLTAFDVNLKILDLIARMTVLPALYTGVIASVISFFFPKRYLTL